MTVSNVSLVAGIPGALPAAGIIAYFLLGQSLDIWQIAGCALVLIGIVILQYEKSEEIQAIE